MTLTGLNILSVDATSPPYSPADSPNVVYNEERLTAQDATSNAGAKIREFK